jgi:hypothetical protein
MAARWHDEETGRTIGAITAAGCTALLVHAGKTGRRD